MAAPADVIVDMIAISISSDTADDNDELPSEIGEDEHVYVQDEIAKHSQTIVEISRMADKMSNLLQEVRNTSRETDDRLRQVEIDLRILGLEE